MTDLFDSGNAVHRRVIAQLDDDLIIWLTSTRPDGRPHSVPVWFLWHEGRFLIYSEPKTQKIRNLRRRGDVVLALETRDAGEEVAFFDGTAEISAEPASAWLPRIGDAYRAKYAGDDPDRDRILAAMPATYTEVIVVTPTRLTAW